MVRLGSIPISAVSGLYVVVCFWAICRCVFLGYMSFCISGLYVFLYFWAICRSVFLGYMSFCISGLYVFLYFWAICSVFLGYMLFCFWAILHYVFLGYIICIEFFFRSLDHCYFKIYSCTLLFSVLLSNHSTLTIILFHVIMANYYYF